MSLLITRHGQTDWNLRRKVQGKSNIGLNEVGIEQAEKLAKKLANEPIDLIICSPLLRARQTAEIINKNRNIPIIYDNRISEIDYGEFEGMELADFNLSAFWNYYNNNKYLRAENIKEFFKRVYDFIDKQKKKKKEKNILLVAHGGISIAVNCYFNGVPADGVVLKMGLHNCEYTKYEFQRKLNYIER